MTLDKDLGMSLWLLPPTTYKPLAALTNLTTSSFPTSSNFPNSPSFMPHITLTSSIPAPSTPLLPSLNLDSIALPTVKYGELIHGNTYFKYIYLRVQKSESLVALAKHVRGIALPDAKEFDEELYDPHLSLVYSNEILTEKKIEFVAWKTSMAIGSSQGWSGGRVALVDTRSTNVEDWKIVEQWEFPETT
jgi:2',3'-cyclic-nucleotide 3'-phosphodiesterase